MNRLVRRALEQGLALNQVAAATANNAYDRLFRRETLVKSGLTPFECIHEGDPMAVRYYPPADGGPGRPVPLVLVPPLGVTTETFDLLPGRSLVRYMSERGFRVYLVDWGRPERRHASLGLADYADDMLAQALAAVRAHSGSRDVSLMGWCMGGLLMLMHAGLTGDQRIRNIVTVASPVDARGGGMVAGVSQALNAPAQLVRRYSEFRLHNVDPALLHVPAWLTTLGFKLTAPLASVTSYWDLVTRLWDREFVESHTTTSDYLDNMLSYPGGVVRDMLVKMAMDNTLSLGRIEIGDGVADFGRITAAMLVMAGDADHLVAPRTAYKSLDLVSSRDKQFVIAPGGHMGVILGARARDSVWATAADWLGKRSGDTAAP
ncbi:hypothetical protein PC39_04960 [Salinisphaera sp. PC39]|uniref:alpha/beta fold hydrolase n=1 Tax=Salinisphaera sp. PC39 TaxID=1304156 RepID=UPI00334062F2